MQRSLLSITGILILGGILLLVNGLSRILLGAFYVDLTDEGLYSLSDGSKNIISKMEDPITLKYYFSRTDASRVPMLKLYGERIGDLLREYERYSDGKITVSSFDPRPDSEEAEWAEKYGLEPIPLPDGPGLSVYLGLTGINGRGDEESLPVFDPARQQLLEYDITRMLYSLQQFKKPVVGILSSLNIKGRPLNPEEMMQGGAPEGSEPWIFVTQLQTITEVKHLEPTVKDIADDINVLVVLHPKNLSEETQYAIDQFVLRGGRLFVAVDPYCQSDEPAMANFQNPAESYMAERSSDLERLLSTWGVKLVKKKVVGDRNLAAPVMTGQAREVTNFVAWPVLKSTNMNTTDVTTNSLENVLLPWPGALEVSAKDGITTEKLFVTTPEAMLIEENNYRFGGGQPESMLRDYRPSGTEQILALRISGKFKSAFPNGRPASSSTEGEKQESGSSAAHLGESKEVSNIVVISDADFLSDRHSVIVRRLMGQKLVMPQNDNLVFLLNIIENLTGSSDLIAVRSRGAFSRAFTKVREIELAAQERWREEEAVYQAKVNTANQALQRFTSGAAGEGTKAIINENILKEVEKLREERKQAQMKLREVRRNLREDKEKLGNWLFMVNTFLIPLLLIGGSIAWSMTKKKKRSEPDQPLKEETRKSVSNL